MCIALIAYNYFDNFPLVILSNRDEYHSRCTKKAHFWEEYPDILAGRDLEQGGTWFGINKKNGRIGLLTNFREPNQDPKKKSRGSLIVDFLVGNFTDKEYLYTLKKTAKKYNGYNIVFGTKNRLFYFNNIKLISQKIPKGVHVLSNGTLQDKWPKCERLRELFFNITKDLSLSTTEKLFEILRDTKKFPDEKLPNTGVGIELERFLSPIFVKDENYGTRTSILLIVDKNNLVRFIERTYVRGSDEVNGDQEFSFSPTLTVEWAKRL